MAKRRVLPTRVPIHTLSGGVGRQGPTKRLPTEAENIDNAFVTLERSFEKRSGFEFIPSTVADDSYSIGPVISGGQDLWYYWFSLSDDLRYLIMLDFGAVDPSQQLIWVFKKTAEGMTDVSPPNNNTTVPVNTRAYITYNPAGKTAQQTLRAINVGQTIVVLNRQVKAGYSSDTAGKLFDLNGVATVNDDTKGVEVDYQTDQAVDAEGLAQIYNNSRFYLKGEETFNPSGTTPVDIFSSKIDQAIPPVTDPPSAGTEWDDTGRNTQQISVKDFIYPDPDHPELGQSVLNFGDLANPPLSGSLTAVVDLGAATAVKDMIAALYPNDGNATGLGRIEYTAQSFGGASPGYYRVKSITTSPYRHKIRTPDKHSLLDQDRMPHALDPTNWRFSAIDWDPRTSGNNDTNPGPSVFKNSKGDALRHVEITAISFFRGRLFLAAADTVFSSRIGDFDNLWVDDPGNLTSGDPIDIRAASNKYTPIQSMTPFSEFLFLTTDGDTQYELTGSEDLITPFTSELKATSFYSTSPLVDPLLMGSQVYFFAAKRLYIYFASAVDNINSALEVSKHIPNYLPVTPVATSVSPAQDSIFVADGDNLNHLYCYINRFGGDQVIQNAFFRFILDEDTEILNTVTFDDELHLLITQPDWNDQRRMYLIKADLTPEDFSIPRIDSRYLHTVTMDNTEWSPVDGTTEFEIPFADKNIDEVIVYSGYEDSYWTRLSIVSMVTDTDSSKSLITVGGQWDTVGAQFYIGKNYEMSVQLSSQYSRDENNNVIDGVLGLRTMVLSHHYTGDYDVEVYRQSRGPLVSSFHRTQAGLLGDIEVSEPYEVQGEFTSKIFGTGSEVDIFIKSLYPTPCNIINMELKGRFKQTYSSAFN